MKNFPLGRARGLKRHGHKPMDLSLNLRAAGKIECHSIRRWWFPPIGGPLHAKKPFLRKTLRIRPLRHEGTTGNVGGGVLEFGFRGITFFDRPPSEQRSHGQSEKAKEQSRRPRRGKIIAS